jgi:putative oxidoreductase
MTSESGRDVARADGGSLAFGPASALAMLAPPLMVVARAMLAYVFILEGWGKIQDYAGVVQYMEQAGVDGRLLPLVILTELGGGLCVLFGLVTRYAAIALFGFCILTAIIFHKGADQAIEFEKNIAIAGGFLTLAVFGSGPWSIDSWLARARGWRL